MTNLEKLTKALKAFEKKWYRMGELCATTTIGEKQREADWKAIEKLDAGRVLQYRVV